MFDRPDHDAPLISDRRSALWKAWLEGDPPGVHGHRTYTCRFLVDGRECGLVLSFPPCRDPDAGPLSWY
jgi:hypothetical protein